MLIEIGQQRAIIERVSPEIDGGRYAIKRTIGEKIVVEADVFADGHDALEVQALYRKEGDTTWTMVPMELVVNDRWRGEFVLTEMGRHVYTVQAHVDRFKTWHRDLKKRLAVSQDVTVELLIGLELVEHAVQQSAATGEQADSQRLQAFTKQLGNTQNRDEQLRAALNDDLYALMMKHPDLSYSVVYNTELPVFVERERARFSAWYELFPRSTAPERGRHGTFKDLEARLPYIASMGFDIVYLPPIHPIGYQFRKGRNNAVIAQPGDVGSPWAIGSHEGGHKAIHPQLGTLKDFRHLVQVTKEHGMEIALDIAFQCAPDHPYVREHPEWFRRRPDGTIQYAENPPKKYQDIYPFDFETRDWRGLWQELKSVMDYWIEQGVFVFRVDNPHTKSFRFWEWAIADIKERHPEVIFLSEAFTKPKVMYNLAKLGFTQSYTYYTWRNTKYDLTTYLTDLTQTDVCEYFRPNFWPNTPDILHAYLQTGGLPAFKARLIMAATMTANYGMYGPTFELGINVPRELGSEEYLDSEKYQLRHWDLDLPHSLRELIGQVNRIRRENPALQSNNNVIFHNTDNDNIICYSKHTDDFENRIMVVVNLDPFNVQSGWVGPNIVGLGLNWAEPYYVHDLLTDASYLWRGDVWNYVELHPQRTPAHIFRI
ncbi:MAG: alpha-1,4-glucan--maltose-1-phosphate maltosyltransferase [Chloroflexaceae bacterium]|nr:alpha-1,4-glucan--maltose-1-phosphate maltosyltransferase [Chloroflexaceae bacterium]NJO05293.1 alpha-1,4-glucan--maltose-1-phosphate maltosyltransferase [Chloroflexaceae bacterium]